MTQAAGAAAFFEEAGAASAYAGNVARFIPGYRDMQRMAALLLAESAGEAGEVLVVGAGGGLELEAFAAQSPGWRFVAVDPSPAMLKEARRVVARAGATARVRWVSGTVFDGPAGPFDGASCLLTLHFVPDDGAKLATLRAVRQRLRPGARFVIVDQCLDYRDPHFQLRLDRYAAFARRSGAAPELVVEATGRSAAGDLPMVSPERETALLGDAGFREIDLFHAGLGWRGWVATA